MRGLCAWFAVVWLLLPPAAFGQAASANLTGTVKDTSGAVLPGVTITAKSVATNEIRTTVSGSDGLYRLTNLPRGTCEVSAELQGFRTLRQSDVLLTVGDTVKLDFPMEVGTVSESITVKGQAPLVNTEEGRVFVLVDEKRVAELPLNGRNAMQLIGAPARRQREPRQPGARRIGGRQRARS